MLEEDSACGVYFSWPEDFPSGASMNDGEADHQSWSIGHAVYETTGEKMQPGYLLKALSQLKRTQDSNLWHYKLVNKFILQARRQKVACKIFASCAMQSRGATVNGFGIVDCDLLAQLPANHYPITGFGAPVTLEQRIDCFRKAIEVPMKGTRNANGFLVHGLPYNDVVARWQECNRRLRTNLQQGLKHVALSKLSEIVLCTLPRSNSCHVNAQDANGMHANGMQEDSEDPETNQLNAMRKRLHEQTNRCDALGKELMSLREQFKKVPEMEKASDEASKMELLTNGASKLRKSIPKLKRIPWKTFKKVLTFTYPQDGITIVPVLRTVDGNGDCLFECTRQLVIRHNSTCPAESKLEDKSILDLRKSCAESISEDVFQDNKDLAIQMQTEGNLFVELENFVDVADRKAYIEQMSICGKDVGYKDSCWGGELELNAMGNLYSMSFLVINQDSISIEESYVKAGMDHLLAKYFVVIVKTDVHYNYCYFKDPKDRCGKNLSTFTLQQLPDTFVYLWKLKGLKQKKLK